MYRLHLHTCNLGSRVRESVNPFTGDVVLSPIDPGLTPSERDAVQAFFIKVAATTPDPDTYIQVVLLDGSVVNVSVGNLYTEQPCVAFALEYDTLTSEVVTFVHDLATRGNMAIVSTINPMVVALPLVEQRERVLPRWPEAEVVKSVADLEAWLRRNIR